MGTNEERTCLYCGKKEHYARGLCRKCYSRLLYQGELNKDKKASYKNKYLKELKNVQNRLRIIEEAERLFAGHKKAWGTQFYVYLADMFEGMTFTEIAEKHNVTRQCVQRIVTDAYYRIDKKVRNNYDN